MEILFWIWLGSISIVDFFLVVVVIKMATILWGGKRYEDTGY